MVAYEPPKEGAKDSSKEGVKEDLVILRWYRFPISDRRIRRLKTPRRGSDRVILRLNPSLCRDNAPRDLFPTRGNGINDCLFTGCEEYEVEPTFNLNF